MTDHDQIGVQAMQPREMVGIVVADDAKFERRIAALGQSLEAQTCVRPRVAFGEAVSFKHLPDRAAALDEIVGSVVLPRVRLDVDPDQMRAVPQRQLRGIANPRLTGAGRVDEND
ncbi:hypothetical protein LPW26_17895 [Rhodopseudomonas sp. HC1]|uniref:hypothetical protein n=1 Tax=Rhodopseudomonas infernalis TaxID=2897386 RepID=UPI001EE82962|nr:hypothetical protein [Rhodopseudomonas infernalis]MCG6206525.1 hypothetical protein [Rhodopseudomonas infernalis]